MHSRPSFSLIGIAVLSNIASGFSCNAQVPPLPTSAFIRNAVPTSASCSMNSLNKNIFQQRDEDIVSSLHARGGDSTELGASAASSDAAVGKDLNLTTGKVLASLWGSCGMVYILVKAIKRVLPIALEPFTKAEGVVPLTQFQLAAYILTCLWFAYVEGYKGFQLKFSPLVVSRSFTLDPSSSPIHHLIFAPFYSMALFHATKKRMIVSWSVSIGVAAVVAAVKRLPYPWRNIVDAGVVVGLTWGTVSILGGYIISLATGIAPIDVDPALPEKKQ
eukprot:CAMPEP_0181088044 /NCGR_PEP_ID=MMETSP1071-20121207/6582_1 /TAXON_ID=35127 /ORGANISM="Thalassiosira sp., Strain NH16" /LENGTH=274 /DNA_ID=CAMNT_0023169945 /DNA_START=40 /DNA_END=864 /DNA_ORIENTATION=-